MSIYDEEQWIPDDFVAKLDSEGGIGEMLAWGGPGSFPPELRGAAEEIKRQYITIESWLMDHGY